MAMLQFITNKHYSGDRLLLPYDANTIKEYEQEHDRLYRKYMSELGHAKLLDEIENHFRSGKGIL